MEKYDKSFIKQTLCELEIYKTKPMLRRRVEGTGIRTFMRIREQGLGFEIRDAGAAVQLCVIYGAVQQAIIAVRPSSWLTFRSSLPRLL